MTYFQLLEVLWATFLLYVLKTEQNCSVMGINSQKQNTFVLFLGTIPIIEQKCSDMGTFPQQNNFVLSKYVTILYGTFKVLYDTLWYFQSTLPYFMVLSKYFTILYGTFKVLYHTLWYFQSTLPYFMVLSKYFTILYGTFKVLYHTLSYFRNTVMHLTSLLRTLSYFHILRTTFVL